MAQKHWLCFQNQHLHTASWEQIQEQSWCFALEFAGLLLEESYGQAKTFSFHSLWRIWAISFFVSYFKWAKTKCETYVFAFSYQLRYQLWIFMKIRRCWYLKTSSTKKVLSWCVHIPSNFWPGLKYEIQTCNRFDTSHMQKPMSQFPDKPDYLLSWEHTAT